MHSSLTVTPQNNNSWRGQKHLDCINSVDDRAVVGFYVMKWNCSCITIFNYMWNVNFISMVDFRYRKSAVRYVWLLSNVHDHCWKYIELNALTAKQIPGLKLFASHTLYTLLHLDIEFVTNLDPLLVFLDTFYWIIFDVHRSINWLKTVHIKTFQDVRYILALFNRYWTIFMSRYIYSISNDLDSLKSFISKLESRRLTVHSIPYTAWLFQTI